jgi:hypothetical protein
MESKSNVRAVAQAIRERVFKRAVYPGNTGWSVAVLSIEMEREIADALEQLKRDWNAEADALAQRLEEQRRHWKHEALMYREAAEASREALIAMKGWKQEAALLSGECETLEEEIQELRDRLARALWALRFGRLTYTGNSERVITVVQDERRALAKTKGHI